MYAHATAYYRGPPDISLCFKILYWQETSAQHPISANHASTEIEVEKGCNISSMLYQELVRRKLPLV